MRVVCHSRRSSSSLRVDGSLQHLATQFTGNTTTRFAGAAGRTSLRLGLAALILLCGVFTTPPSSAQTTSTPIASPTNPSGPAWTWVGGNQDGSTTVPASLGTQGVASSSNFPGSSAGGVTWTDSSGNLWLFGGVQMDATGNTVNYGNVLWRYSPAGKQWTWIGGGSPEGFDQDSGSYGSLGVEQASNLPPGRSGALSWTDASGNFWLFGGNYEGFAYDDLWRFRPVTNLWTWMGGTTTSYGSPSDGSYGTKGVPSSTNLPPGRSEAFVWTDTSGNLWLFGGVPGPQGHSLNDLWQYSIASGQWTWSGGMAAQAQALNSGVYGSKGVASIANIPGSRSAGASWTDASGNLWLFGGLGEDATTGYGLLNDLWEYVPAANTWTWVGGASKLPPISGQNSYAIATGSYGTYSVASATNVPTGRRGPTAWTDASGNFWLFGGDTGGSNINPGDLNDVWMYSSATNTWAWMDGSSNTGSITGNYGAQGIPSTSNIPGSRTGPLFWTDLDHNLWLFGGTDNNTNSESDLWTTAVAGTSQCPNNPATPYINCNPGGTTVVTATRTEQLTFATPVITSASASAFSTEIVAKYNGATVYDQTFAAAYGTPTVQDGITAADAAVVAAGGTASQIPSPILTSSSTNAGSVSASTYSIAQPASSTTVFTQTLTNTFGPATIMAAVGGLANPANPTAGQVTQCTEASLPSMTLPTCMATNAGTVQINAGQEDTNVNTDSNYLINTATTTTTTTTTTAAYAINAVANAPVISLMPAGPLNFSSTAGITSAAQTVTITNSGTATLSLTGISLTGTNATSFAQTNTCSATLAASAGCMVSVTFSPGTNGSFTAALLIADNVTGSPQSIALSGTSNTAPTFTITATPTTQSVQAGSTAHYTLTVTPQNGAYTSAVSLSVAALPSGVTATFSPATLTPGSSPATSALTIQTPAYLVKTEPPSRGRNWKLGTPTLALVLLLVIPRRRRRRSLTFGLLLIATFCASTGLSGCGDSGLRLPASTSNFTITVSAASGTQQQTVAVQLTVQQ